jgi:hypothetical protein
MNSTQSIATISKALVKAQGLMGSAKKDAKNPFFKSTYADLNAIREACIPVLNECGISVLQPTTIVDGKAVVETVLLHESGELISSFIEIVCAKSNDPQAQGSAISYARRYALKSILNIGDTDDDGEAAVGRAAAAAPAPTKEVAKAAAVDTATIMKKISSTASVLFSKETYSPESLTAYLKDTYNVTAKEKLSPVQAKEFLEFLESKTKETK